MSRYLLDTTALIDFSKRREPAFSLVHRLIAQGEELGVCSVNVGEFYTGIRAADRPLWDQFFAAVRYWEITQEAARQAGIFRHDFARLGVALSMTNALIAAVALERQAILVTGNSKDFPMPELQLLPLRDSP